MGVDYRVKVALPSRDVAHGICRKAGLAGHLKVEAGRSGPPS